jgi:ATP-dependent DNA helicase RecG
MDFKDLMDGYESISRDFPLPQYAISILQNETSEKKMLK